MSGDGDYAKALGMDGLVAESRKIAQELLDAPDAVAAYRKGMSLLSLGMGNVGSTEATDDIAGPLYLVWGSLTDAIDSPRADPDPTAAASTMRRAAREWLSVGTERDAQRQYFDRWLYEECGYARPTEPT